MLFIATERQYAALQDATRTRRAITSLHSLAGSTARIESLRDRAARFERNEHDATRG